MNANNRSESFVRGRRADLALVQVQEDSVHASALVSAGDVLLPVGAVDLFRRAQGQGPHMRSCAERQHGGTSLGSVCRGVRVQVTWHPALAHRRSERSGDAHPVALMRALGLRPHNI